MATKGKQEVSTQDAEEMAEAERIITADVESLRPSQRAVLQLLYWLENTATEDTGETPEFGGDIANILLADSDAEMWDADDIPSYNARVLSGCEMALYGIEAKFSSSPDITTGLIGPTTKRKMYVMVTAARINNAGQNALYRLPEVGEEFKWNTSARFIVAKLYWLSSRGRFDNGSIVYAKIQGTKLDGEKSVEKLKLLEAPLVEGQMEQIPF